MKGSLKHLGIFFLVGMLFAKISAFHVYEHHNAEDNEVGQCELCILAIDNQQTETATFSFGEFNEPNSFGDYGPGLFFTSVQIPKIQLESHHCSRPPPSFI
ncbi:hypothetical protein [Ulvibacterium sp.]|uniref:hypothetical protein n=1 Tax=Ulvibacterium sp. TaxID=2665914 RepID=UPI003BAC92DC